MGFEVSKITAEEALRFYTNNSAGTVFHHPEVAKILGPECEWRAVLKGSEPFQIFPIWRAENDFVKPPNFTYYFGPYWSDTYLSRPTSSRFGDSQKILRLVLDHLATNFTDFEFEFHYSETDMRPFLWWNYDRKNPPLTIVPRYSALIQNLQAVTKESLAAGFRSVRRQEIKKAESSLRFVAGDHISWQDVKHLYSNVLKRSGQGLDKSLESLQSLESLLETPFSDCTPILDRETGDLASLTLTLRDKGVTHLVLALTANDFRRSGVGPLAIRDTILRARDMGDHTFDFNGANSPLRGDDKHSYGAEPALYFRVSSKQS